MISPGDETVGRSAIVMTHTVLRLVQRQVNLALRMVRAGYHDEAESMLDELSISLMEAVGEAEGSHAAAGGVRSSNAD